MSSFFFLLSSSSAASLRLLLIALLKSSAEWALTLIRLAPGKILSIRSVRVHSSCWYVYIKRTSKHVIPSKKRITRRREVSGIVAEKELQTHCNRWTDGSSGVCIHIPLTGWNYAFLTFSYAVPFLPKCFEVWLLIWQCFHQTLYFPNNALNYINCGVIKKHYKCKTCCNMFRFTQEPSSGSQSQCLAKITGLVPLCLTIWALSVLWRHIMPP